MAETTGLQIDVSTHSERAELQLTGDLDADSADTLVAMATGLIEQGHQHLVLDCAGVTFCDSFGLRAMTVLADRARPDGSFVIARPPMALARILDITGLSAQFGIAERAS